MINPNDDNRTKDPGLQQALDVICQLKAPSTPDVTDSVMQRIATMPQPFAPQHSRRANFRIISSAVAACFAGIVVTFVFLRNNSAQAANISPEMPYRLYDIYQYCNDYADDETVESAAYYENPITELI